jgi:hypothetical protein
VTYIIMFRGPAWSMDKIGYFIAVVTADFWLFGPFFGSLVTAIAVIPFLKIMMLISADRRLHVTRKSEQRTYPDHIWPALFIYSAKTCLRGKTPPRLGHLASEVILQDLPYHLRIGRPCPIQNGKICPPATSEAGARWPRRGEVFPRRHVFIE